MPAIRDHPLLPTYYHMVNRCGDPNDPNYRYYGGRGISVCSRWLDSFWNFVEDMGDRPEGLTLDREDVNGDYCPSNCRWTDSSTQSLNRRLWVHNYNRRWLPGINILPYGEYKLQMKLTTGRHYYTTYEHLDDAIDDYNETLYERTFHRALGLRY